MYINTSHEMKALSVSIVPTIACMSSNVLHTMLQVSTQLGPGELRVCYSPNTYMGENLVSLLDAVLTLRWSNSRICRKLHPQHNRLTIGSLRDNVVVYPGGNCVVHQMFGMSVADAVEREYPKAHVTTHYEVPGKIFCIVLRKILLDKGVVGSTSNILASLSARSGRPRSRSRLQLPCHCPRMVTMIVRSMQDTLESHPCGSKGGD
jgi:quinolinate synthase